MSLQPKKSCAANKTTVCVTSKKGTTVPGHIMCRYLYHSPTNYCTMGLVITTDKSKSNQPHQCLMLQSCHGNSNTFTVAQAHMNPAGKAQRDKHQSCCNNRVERWLIISIKTHLSHMGGLISKDAVRIQTGLGSAAVQAKRCGHDSSFLLTCGTPLYTA